MSELENGGGQHEPLEVELFRANLIAMLMNSTHQKATVETIMAGLAVVGWKFVIAASDNYPGRISVSVMAPEGNSMLECLHAPVEDIHRVCLDVMHARATEN